jgi:hypothetical protein
MSDIKLHVSSAQGNKLVTVTFEGKIKTVHWDEFIEKLKALAKQYGITVKR